MIQKKVCMLGSFAVGKTSLVSRYVQGIFSERYLTTVGVKIDKREVEVSGQTANLVLWDLAGEDEFLRLQASYLRGLSGYLLVVDGTRLATLQQAFDMRGRHAELLDDVPGLLLVNKADLKTAWQLGAAELDRLASDGWEVIESSAKTGVGVATAFDRLATKMLLGDAG